jgi:hypothetical protein
MTTTSIRRRAAFAIATGTVAVASLAAAGAANAAQPAGFSPVQSCTGLTGSISYSPGLLSASARTVHSVLTGTLTGCSGLNGAEAGTGTVTIVASGSSKTGAITQTGTMTVNWPVGSGLNPSNGTVTLRRFGTTSPFTLSGTFTSGAYTGAAVSSNVLVTTHTGSGTKAHPITLQNYVNTAPFVASENFG